MNMPLDATLSVSSPAARRLSRTSWLDARTLRFLDRRFAGGVVLPGRLHEEAFATTFATRWPEGEYAANVARHLRADAGSEHVALEWIGAVLGREVAS